MKKIFVMMVVCTLMFSGVAIAQDAEDNSPITKLGRGVVNILDALVEIPGTMMRESEAEGVATGLTKGTVMGIVNTVVRALAGAYEVATFPVPVPQGYEPIMDDPKFLAKE